MLKKRLLTALILAPLLIWIIKLPNPIYFQALLVVIGVIAVKEWGVLAQFTKARHYVFFVFLCLFYIAFMAALVFILSGLAIIPMIGLPLIWWMFNLVFIFTYPKSQKYFYGNVYLRAMNGVMLLLPSLLMLGYLQAGDADMLLFLLLIIWSADIGSYFAGKHFGKHLLAPKISPKKTIEGVLGGMLGSMVLTAILSAWVYQQVELKHLLLSALIALVSVVGDLYESLFKRAANVKDSGSILPGHGGILDRIDSLLPVIVVFPLLLIFVLPPQSDCEIQAQQLSKKHNTSYICTPEGIQKISPINPDLFSLPSAPILK